MPFIDLISAPLIVQTYVSIFFISFFHCFIIVLSSGYAFSRRAKLDESAIQSAHSGFVPRVGGLAIYISTFTIVPLLSFGFVPLSILFDLDSFFITLLMLSALPVFSIGFAEDLGYQMSPMIRLISSAISSFFAILFFKVWISQLGISGIDALLMIHPIGILFTVFATVGVVNAFNLIDGLNGLSSYVTISVSLALSIVAFKVGEEQIAVFLVLLTAAVFGFMVLNFPIGKIFLGDAGAYFLGHILVWSAVLIINYAEEVSPFAILLIFFWPVADTGLAIWRRWKLGNPTDSPDRLHFHQLVMRFLEIRFFGRNKRYFANPVATLVLVPLISVPQVVGVLYINDFSASVWLTLIMGILFVSTYVLGVNLAKRTRGLSQ